MSKRAAFGGERVGRDISIDSVEERVSIQRFWRAPRVIAIACAGLCALTLARAAQGVEKPVALGEIAAGSAERPELTESLRKALREELDQVDFGGRRPRQRYVLSATLLRLDSVTESESVRATCVISVAL